MIVILICLWVSLNPGLGFSKNGPIAGVSRPNFGVDFNFLFSLNNMHGSWKHAWTFDISMLDRPTFKSGKLQCFNEALPLCQAEHEFLNSTYNMFTDMLKKSGDKHAWLLDPEILATLERFDHRSKRALAPFVGDIEHFLFGITTDSELAGIQKTLDDITELSGRTKKEITNLGDNLASLSQLTQSINANSKQGLLELHLMLGNLTGKVNERMQTLERFYNQASNKTDNLEREMMRSWMIDQQVTRLLVAVMETVQADQRILSGIQTVLQGFIPIEWVSPKDLRDGLAIAEEGVRQLFPEARLTHSQRALGFYYTHKLVTPIISTRRITLVVDIPVDLGQQILNVYAVRRYPVSLLSYNPYLKVADGHDTQSRAISILDEDHDYFLISQDGQMYSTAHNQDVELCRGEMIRECPKQFPLYNIKYESCLQSLWSDAGFETVLGSCPYKLHHIRQAQELHLYVQVIPLSNGRWYIDAPLNEPWTIVCPQRAPEVRHACTSCVIQVDCGCGIQSKWFQIPTRLSTCANVFSPLSKNYTINPFQYRSEDVPWIVNLTGSHQFTSPMMDIPNINLPSGDNWDDVMESMDAKQYDLNRLYNKQKNETEMYRTTAEALLEKIKSQDKVLSEIASWPSWIVTTALALSFVNSACLFLLCFCILNKGVHGAALSAAWTNEKPLIDETSTAMIVSLDFIILVIVSIILFLQVIMAWPIISQWIQSRRWFKSWADSTRMIKACSFRTFGGQPIASIQGVATFIWRNNRRQVPMSVGISGVPKGTHLIDMNAHVDSAMITKEDEVYHVCLTTGYNLITLQDRVIEIRDFYIMADEVHAEYDIPEKYEFVEISQVKFAFLPANTL